MPHVAFRRGPGAAVGAVVSFGASDDECAGLVPYFRPRLCCSDIIIEAMTGELHVNAMRLRGLSREPCARLVDATAVVGSGIWYYEVLMLSSGQVPSAAVPVAPDLQPLSRSHAFASVPAQSCRLVVGVPPLPPPRAHSYTDTIHVVLAQPPAEFCCCWLYACGCCQCHIGWAAVGFHADQGQVRVCLLHHSVVQSCLSRPWRTPPPRGCAAVCGGLLLLCSCTASAGMRCRGRTTAPGAAKSTATHALHTVCDGGLGTLWAAGLTAARCCPPPA
jgi:hypothetical protein